MIVVDQTPQISNLQMNNTQERSENYSLIDSINRVSSLLDATNRPEKIAAPNHKKRKYINKKQSIMQTLNKKIKLMENKIKQQNNIIQDQEQRLKQMSLQFDELRDLSAATAQDCWSRIIKDGKLIARVLLPLINLKLPSKIPELEERIQAIQSCMHETSAEQYNLSSTNSNSSDSSGFTTLASEEEVAGFF